MGFNSTVVVLNDALHTIRQDPDFGNKLCDAITRHRNGGRSLVTARDGNCSHHGAAEVVAVEHADHSVLVLVGGNTATVLDAQACGWEHHEEKAQLVALQSFADKMGFRLVKKTKA
jgi:hypothetical protein